MRYEYLVPGTTCGTSCSLVGRERVHKYQVLQGGRNKGRRKEIFREYLYLVELTLYRYKYCEYRIEA